MCGQDCSTFYFSYVKGGIQMPTKKKEGKSRETKKISMEKQVKNLENNISIIEKIARQEKEEAEKEEKRQKSIREKIEAMRKDLRAQLLNQNKIGEQFDDMVENYLFLVQLKENLQNDISINGFRYEAKTGNGYTTDKPNESVQNLLKVSAEMRKILQDMGLKEPGQTIGEGDRQDDLLQ